MEEKMKSERKKVIIDTDPGVDDALAIAYAVRSQLLEVVALTTVFGNSNISETTNNALSIVNILGQDIPVYRGSGIRIDGSYPETVAQSQIEAVKYFASKQKSEIQEMAAVDAIISILENSLEPISIIAIGPLTNIALAYQKSPQSFQTLDNIFIMDGAIQTYGNTTQVAEFNVYSDPMAADVVLNSGLPKILIPVDVCRKVVMTPDELKDMEDNSIFDDLGDLVGQYMAYYAQTENLGGAVMYDPVAVGLCINPGFITRQMPLYVRVETQGLLTKGQTVADLRPDNTNEPNIDVCLNVDAVKLKKDFYAALMKGKNLEDFGG